MLLLVSSPSYFAACWLCISTAVIGVIITWKLLQIVMEPVASTAVTQVYCVVCINYLVGVGCCLVCGGKIPAAETIFVDWRELVGEEEAAEEDGPSSIRVYVACEPRQRSPRDGTAD